MRNNKDKILNLLVEVLMNKYNFEISRKDKLEEKGYKWISISFIYISFYLVIRYFFPLNMIKLPFILDLILGLSYGFLFSFNLSMLYVIYGLKTRGEVDILSEWDDLVSDSYSACVYSIRYAMLDTIKALEDENNKLAKNVKAISLVNTIGGVITLIICIWRVNIGR